MKQTQAEKASYEALQAEEQVRARARPRRRHRSTAPSRPSARATTRRPRSIAKAALEKDPRNEKAEELRNAAFRAGRTKVRDEYVRAKSEQFRRWQEAMKEMHIPYTDVITLPDAERWNEITEHARQAPRHRPLGATSPEREQACASSCAPRRIPGLHGRGRGEPDAR